MQFVRRGCAVLASTALVMSGLGIWGPVGIAHAASLAGSTFEIDSDANLTPSTGIDWLATAGGAMRSGVSVVNDMPAGATDNSFKSTAEDDTPATVDAGSIPNNKVDLQSFGMYAEHAGTDVFLNLFFTRASTTGDANMDFEFNQSPNVKNNPAGSTQVIPVRTPGDLLLTYDYTPTGGGSLVISERRWLAAGQWGPATSPGVNALGSINSSAIAATDSGGLGALDPFTFGEASLNLLGLLPQNQGCVTYGSVYVKSRASSSFSAELKDFIAPQSATISNCGSVKVHKTNGAGSAMSGAGFTLYRDDAPLGGVAHGVEDTLAVASGSTDGSGNLTLSNIPKGDYWLVETGVPAGHSAAADQHVSITAGDQVVPFNLDDPFTARTNLSATVTATGSQHQDDLWTITKDVNKTKVNIADGSTATFDYSVTVSPNGQTNGNYALTGNVHVVNPNPLDDIPVTATVATTVGGGATCPVTGGVGATVPHSSSIDLPYTCTFTSAPAAGNVTATVTWDAAAAHTPSGTTSDTTGATFPVTAETNKTITVVDDQTDPANPVTLGTQDHSAAAHTYTYSLTKAGVGGKCTDYTNTASIKETAQTASKTVTVCVGQDLTVTKTALTAQHRTFLWNISKDVDKTQRNVSAGGTATFTYTVTATPNGSTDDGWSTTGDITVTNPNAWEDIDADVTDTVNVGGGATCTVNGSTHVTVKALSTEKLTYSCTFTGVPGNGTNTATATWDATKAATPTGTATGTAAVVFQPTSKTNETITVVDDKTDPAHPVTLGTATWSAGPTTFTYTLGLQGNAGTSTSYTNVASIAQTGQTATKTVTVNVGSPLSVSATAQGSFGRTDLWAISKDVDKTTVHAASGTTATFHYTVTATPSGFADGSYTLNGNVTVTNPNSWEAITGNVTVTTSVDPAATCTVTGGTGKSVPANSSVTLAYACSLTGTPALAGNVTASVAWDSVAASTATGSASSSAPVAFGVGGTANSTVTVVDDMTDPNNPVTLGTATWSNGPTSFTYALDKAGVAGSCRSYTNTATITQTQQSSSKQVTVCLADPLAVAVTAQGSYDRDDLWSITKDVDHTTLTTATGGVVTFHYTVTAKPNGFANSAYALGGNVTVTNSNDWQAIASDVTVTTDVDPGASCTVTGGTGVSVAAGGSVTLPFVCSFTGTPSLTGSVVATATWDATAASTATGTATTTTATSLVQSGEAHSTVTVVDDKTDPANPVTLGTATWANGDTAFSYDVNKTVGTGCVTYTNTASLVETGQSASQDVAACGEFTGGGGVITPPAKGGGTLTFTGAYTSVMAEWALAALGAGLLLLLLGRRRRTS